MACITWKPIRAQYTAYMETSYYDPEKKGPRYKGTYLGSTPQRAEAKLKTLVQDKEELARLTKELYRKHPPGRPPQDERSKAIKTLDRLINKTSDVQAREILQEAINRLKEVVGNGKENREK